MNTTNIDFSSNALDALRSEIRASLSERRFAHVAAVEAMIDRLGALYLPDKRPMLRAAALLHDLTKEFSNERHEEIFASHGIIVTDEKRLSPKLYHAETAALLIPERYPHFADPALLSAVRYHTTGREEMTLFDLLLYLADYIDENRTFPDCVFLRDYFWGKDPASMPKEERLRHLYDTVVLSVDLSVAALASDRAMVSVESVLMRNRLLFLLKTQNA